jgi:GTP 3',8-cyclase
MELIDTYGRRINYLRLSVTDRCNLRCSYCMPEQGVPKLSHDDMLSYEELLRVAREAVAIGIEKIRITGGEPLVRKGITGFFRDLALIPGLKELVLTTNGICLPEMSAELYRAGVQRLNISLDSLRAETFARITRGGDVLKVLKGLDTAEQAGFPPHKINMVVMRGINDDELLDFAALTLERPYTVRFIEYMPTLQADDWRSLCVPGSEILERIGTRFSLLPLASAELAGPARNFRISGAAGSIGIITPISGHFCNDCNRIRVTAAGMARSCLFAGEGVDLKPLLAEGYEGRLRDELRRIVTAKPGMHGLSDGNSGAVPFAMSRVGG